MPDLETAGSGEVTETTTTETAAADGGTTTTEAPSYEAKIQEIAAKAGWKETGPMNAEEFLATMPDRFRDKGKELKDMKRSIDAIKHTFDKAQQSAYQRGIEEAQGRLAAAKEAFDVEGVERATRELEAARVNAPKVANNLSPEAEAFINMPELDKDPVLLTDAMDYREKYLKTNPGDINGALLYAQKKMARDYPEIFGPKTAATATETKKAPAGSVEGVSGSTPNVAQWQKDEKMLMPHEIEMMKAFTGQLHNGKPVMTKQQYIENLRARGAFEGRK